MKTTEGYAELLPVAKSRFKKLVVDGYLFNSLKQNVDPTIGDIFNCAHVRCPAKYRYYRLEFEVGVYGTSKHTHPKPTEIIENYKNRALQSGLKIEHPKVSKNRFTTPRRRSIGTALIPKAVMAPQISDVVQPKAVKTSEVSNFVQLKDVKTSEVSEVLELYYDRARRSLTRDTFLDDDNDDSRSVAPPTRMGERSIKRHTLTWHPATQERAKEMPMVALQPSATQERAMEMPMVALQPPASSSSLVVAPRSSNVVALREVSAPVSIRRNSVTSMTVGPSDAPMSTFVLQAPTKGFETFVAFLESCCRGYFHIKNPKH